MCIRDRPQIANAAVTIILELTNGLLALLPQLIEAAMQMIATLALGIGEALPQLVPTIIQILTTVAVSYTHLGLAKPQRELFIDDIIPEGI